MRGGYLTGAAVVALLLGGGAQAETLQEALVRTYAGNPTITGQRANLRTLDEDVAIARAGARPTISATAGVNQDLTRTGGGSGRNINAGVDLNYPLFTGGRVGLAILSQGVSQIALGRRAGDGFGVAPVSDVATTILPGFLKPRTFTF